MILTDEKIKVTDQMLTASGMARVNKYGIPKDTKDLSKGLVWKLVTDLTDEDFDKLEEYFINKSNKGK